MLKNLETLAASHAAAGRILLAEMVAAEAALIRRAGRATMRDAEPREFFPLSGLVE